MLGCLAAAASVWRIAVQHEYDDLQAEFDFRVRETTAKIEGRMRVYAQVLRGAQGMLAASDEIDRAKFRLYIDSLHVQENYPGIQGIGISLIVPEGKKTAHLTSGRGDGFPAYAIWPEGKRSPYTSIIQLEPSTSRNMGALGYDMYSEQVRREAMERARDTAAPSISGKVRLVNETEQALQAGFLMYLPLYRNGATPSTLAARRASIVGWVYMPFRMNNLMSNLSSERAADLDIKIFDGEMIAHETLMYDTDKDNLSIHSMEPMFKSLQRIEVIGHAWTLAIHSMPALEKHRHAAKPVSIAAVGILLSMLLTLLTYLLATGRTRALAVASDMTRELKESQEVWQFALEGSGDGVWDWNVQTGQMIFSSHSKGLFGYSDEEIADHVDEWKMRVHPDDVSRTMVDLDACFSGASANYVNEHRMLCKDGGWKWVLARGKLISRTEDGRPLRIVGTTTDISERKQAEEELKLAALVFQNAGEAMTVTDADGNIIAVNPAFTLLTGYAAEEVMGKNPRILKSGRHGRDFYEAMWNSITTTGRWKGEIWNRRKDGVIYPERLSISTVFNDDGTVQRYVAMFQDISKEKEAEATIRALSAKHVEVKEEEGKRIAREIHDDLGQRLTLLRMEVLMLPKVISAHGEGLQEAVARMKSSIDECIKIVRNIVAELRPAVLDIGIVPAIEWLLEDFEKKSGIECIFHDLIEGGITPSDQQATGIFRILQESLTNVAKHARATCIEVDLQIHDGWLRLEIADNGVGIENAGPERSPSYGLTGMRERAAMLGGNISVGGRPGSGTLLTLSIPLLSVTSLNQ